MLHSTSIDFLIQLKNAYAAGHSSLTLPSSKFIKTLAKILQQHSFIKGYSFSHHKKPLIRLVLDYQHHRPATEKIIIFSKPGRRWYEKKSSLPWGKQPNSLIIVSTSQGLMSAASAVKKGLGGEIIAEVY